MYEVYLFKTIFITETLAFYQVEFCPVVYSSNIMIVSILDGHARQDSMDVNNQDHSGDCKCPKVKTLDRRKHRKCLAHSLVGTPNYIAPEVLLRTG